MHGMKTTHQIVLTEEYIAEVQRLTVAQNTALRLMYQSWWFLWIPRLVLSATGLVYYFLFDDWVFPALFCGGLITLSFFGWYVFQRKLAKARKKSPVKDTTSTVSMDANGIDAVGAFGNSHTNWIAVQKPVIYPNGVLIRFSRLSMLWLPDQSLIEGIPAEVRQLLADNVKERAT